MKFFAVVCIILILINFVFGLINNHGCNSQPCGTGKICQTLNGVCSCIETNKCNSVELDLKVKSHWDVEKKIYTHYDVIISNKIDVDITNIYIGTDLKDFASIWNVNRLLNGELILPSYQQSINKNSTFTFGFILSGNVVPSLQIYAVQFSN